MRAFAKINVGLWITSKREDGYHTLETVFLPIDLYDIIDIKKAEEFSIVGPNFGDDDLMTKAYHYLRERYGDVPATVFIEKHIPVGAGLAGGTSDGAEVLKALRDLYHLPLRDRQLIDETASLGADFPYCIYGRPAIGRGIGDELTPIDVPSYPVILINPGFSVVTKDAYSMWSRRGEGSPEEALDLLQSGNLERLRHVVVNDLMKGVADKHPIIREMIETLYDNGASFAQMTGSGPTVYGLFNKTSERDVAYDILKDKYEIVIKTKTKTAGEGNG